MGAPAGPSNSSLQTWTHVTFGGVDTTGDVSLVQAMAPPRVSARVALRIRAIDSTPWCGNLDPGRILLIYPFQVSETLYTRVRSRQSLGWESRCDSNDAHAGRARSRNPGRRILDHNAISGGLAQPRCGDEVSLGIRLPTRDLIGADHHRGYA